MMQQWENSFQNIIIETVSSVDPAHDFLHFKRVVNTAKRICSKENGNMQIVVPAAWLHDCVFVAKDSPQRNLASKLSAEKAIDILSLIGYPKEFYGDIYHAIECHSFSANVEAKTLEAKIVQDADRLDGIGAIGVARCFAVAGLLNRPFYSNQDPFCEERFPDDSQFTIDHFYKKLFKIATTLKTETGREEGQRRLVEMTVFVEALKKEIAYGENCSFS